MERLAKGHRLKDNSPSGSLLQPNLIFCTGTRLLGGEKKQGENRKKKSEGKQKKREEKKCIPSRESDVCEQFKRTLSYIGSRKVVVYFFLAGSGGVGGWLIDFK